MTRTRKLTLAAVAGTLIAAGAFAVSQAHGPAGDRLDHMVERMTEHLDLSAEQETQVRATLTAHREAFHTLRERLQAQRGALIQSLRSGEDAAALDAHAERIGDDVAELVRLVGRVKGEVDSALTAEQRAQLNDFLARRMERGGRGFGRHGGHHRD